jgi:hypothetical protein
MDFIGALETFDADWVQVVGKYPPPLTLTLTLTFDVGWVVVANHP